MNAPVRHFAEQSVPRYTSYPTAPHFSAKVSAADYVRWLSELPADVALSLYFHVPFCKEICFYCGCHTKATRKHAPVERYAEILKREIAAIAALTGRRKVSHLHWGGGTPSMLGTEMLLELNREIRRLFRIAEDVEHAFELDPRRVDETLAGALARIGVNRVSLGVQDFSPHVMEAIGRRQSYPTVVRALNTLRGAGIRQVSFDLMYGLPRQTVESIKATVELACGLYPQRISLFGYAHVPQLKRNQTQIDASLLPSSEERFAQMNAAREWLLSYGYQPVGFDHFALPGDPLAVRARTGRLRRNFQGYTSDGADALIGFGTSAISRLPQGYAQNTVDMASYAKAIGSGMPATARGLTLSEDDKLRGAIIERILCDMSVDLRDFRDCGPFTAEIDALRPLANLGLVEIDRDIVRIPERGRNYARIAASAFDAYLTRGNAAFSKAI